MKSKSLLATILVSNNLASQVFVSVTLVEFIPTCLEGNIPILKCLHNNEYKANVPPTIQLKLKFINMKRVMLNSAPGAGALVKHT
jgi:hypothetical protein